MSNEEPKNTASHKREYIIAAVVLLMLIIIVVVVAVVANNAKGENKNPENSSMYAVVTEPFLEWNSIANKTIIRVEVKNTSDVDIIMRVSYTDADYNEILSQPRAIKVGETAVLEARTSKRYGSIKALSVKYSAFKNSK